MTSYTDFVSPFSFDMRNLWNMNRKSFNYAENAYRAWLAAAGEIQTDVVGFMNNYFAKYSAAVTRIGQCKTPAEVLHAQTEYAQSALADLMSEGQKIAARFSNVAQPMFAAQASTEAAPASQRKASRGR
jgi:phasin protein